MKAITQINDLIDKHGDTFTKCQGCKTCKEIEHLRIKLESRKKDICQPILDKGQDMKKEDVQILLDHGFTKTELAKLLNINHAHFYEILDNWGVSGRKRYKK